MRIASARAAGLLLAAFALAALGQAGPELATISGPGNIERLHELGIDFVSESPRLPCDAFLTPGQRAAVEALGFRVEPLPRPLYSDLLDAYHSYPATLQVFDSLRSRHPDIVALRVIGTSQWRKVPIYAVKISANVAAREDKPAVLLTGVTHAREPLGNEVIIHLAKCLCAGYDSSPEVRRWVDSAAIWLVPVVNPDGFMYIFETARSSPWWRKNQRDNNKDQVFDPEYDGVDLNRNFDWRWFSGGQTNPSSWYYRGPAPGSESEVQALCDLAREIRPVFGISYHSYGEVIFYPWSVEDRYSPDDDIYTALAERMGELVGYSTRRHNASNMSDGWLYARLGQLDFIVETGVRFIEPASRIPGILRQNLHADTFLLNRLFYSGVRGRVIDSVTGEPLVAEVQVLDRVDMLLDPRVTDPVFGSFHRVLLPSTYSFRFISPGYDTATITDVSVVPDSLTRLEVRLRQAADTGEQPGIALPAVSIRPNPFTVRTSIHLARGEGSVRILDVGGRLVRTLDCGPTVAWKGDDESGRPLPSGVYYLAAPGIGRPVQVRLVRR